MKETYPISIELKISTPRKTRLNNYAGLPASTQEISVLNPSGYINTLGCSEEHVSARGLVKINPGCILHGKTPFLSYQLNLLNLQPSNAALLCLNFCILYILVKLFSYWWTSQAYCRLIIGFVNLKLKCLNFRLCQWESIIPVSAHMQTKSVVPPFTQEKIFATRVCNATYRYLHLVWPFELILIISLSYFTFNYINLCADKQLSYTICIYLFYHSNFIYILCIDNLWI